MLTDLLTYSISLKYYISGDLRGTIILMKFWQMISVFQVSFQAQSMRQKCANPEGYQLFVGMTHDLDFGLFVRNHWFLRNGVSKFNTIRSSEVYENLERFDFLLSFIVLFFHCWGFYVYNVHTKEGYNKNFLAWIFVSDSGFPWVSSLKKEQQK